ncbi:MAG: aminoacyl-tRNA hydrolase [Actinomycetes bacterium]|jgi:PTH1 family peptidyl-tRNA hydrolase
MSDRWIVFGLGNPGDQYTSTRHNAGHMVADYLASTAQFSSHKSRCEIAEIRVAGSAVTVAKSKLYMNESGAPLKALADFYKVAPENIIVIHDEIDIPFNTIRMKLGGGDNGHNGLKDITKHFAGADYYRVRIGVGRPPLPQDPADYVLKPFSSTEKKELEDFIARSALAVERLIEKGLELAQQEFNT